MRHIIAAALLILLALPALAVTPQAGDFVLMINDAPFQVVHIDRDTQQETVLSCWTGCATPIGSGPEPWPFGSEVITVGPDGAIYFRGSEGMSEGIYRVDPQTGNRALASTRSAGFYSGFLTWPAPSYVPSTVASLGGWGLATLLLGIVIGLQMRSRMRAM